MGLDAAEAPAPRSLVRATDIDVLPLDREVTRRDGYLVVRSPGNPAHYWGNLVIFDDAPRPGDAAAWEGVFAAELGQDPRVRHRTFAWDRVDGAAGAAREEFVARGYDLDETIGLVASTSDLRAHPRENRNVAIRELDPRAGADADLWDAVVELQVSTRDPEHGEDEHREFTRTRLDDRRRLFAAGRGGWFVAVDPTAGAVVASCGVVVTGTRGRFQVVDTAAEHRRRGIASRLVVEAAKRAADAYGATRFVIAADADYHALGLYESLGFRRAEHVIGVCLWPRGRDASADRA